MNQRLLHWLDCGCGSQKKQESYMISGFCMAARIALKRFQRFHTENFFSLFDNALLRNGEVWKKLHAYVCLAQVFDSTLSVVEFVWKTGAEWLLTLLSWKYILLIREPAISIPRLPGTSGSFRHVYEDPILASRQPGATAEEQRLGQSRAAELNRLTGMFILRRTQEINNQYLPPRGRSWSLAQR